MKIRQTQKSDQIFRLELLLDEIEILIDFMHDPLYDKIALKEDLATLKHMINRVKEEIEKCVL